MLKYSLMDDSITKEENIESLLAIIVNIETKTVYIRLAFEENDTGVYSDIDALDEYACLDVHDILLMIGAAYEHLIRTHEYIRNNGWSEYALANKQRLTISSDGAVLANIESDYTLLGYKPVDYEGVATYESCCALEPDDLAGIASVIRAKAVKMIADLLPDDYEGDRVIKAEDLFNDMLRSLAADKVF